MLVQAERLHACVSCRHEVAGDVDAEHVSPELRGRESGRAVAAAEIEDAQAVVDADASQPAASPLSRIDAAILVKSPFSQSALLGFSAVAAGANLPPPEGGHPDRPFGRGGRKRYELRWLT